MWLCWSHARAPAPYFAKMYILSITWAHTIQMPSHFIFFEGNYFPSFTLELVFFQGFFTRDTKWRKKYTPTLLDKVIDHRDLGKSFHDILAINELS